MDSENDLEIMCKLKDYNTKPSRTPEVPGIIFEYLFPSEQKALYDPLNKKGGY